MANTFPTKTTKEYTQRPQAIQMYYLWSLWKPWWSLWEMYSDLFIIKPPSSLKIPRHCLIRQNSPQHFYRHSILR